MINDDSTAETGTSIQSLGGLARAKTMTPEERSESARKAALAKWEQSPTAKKMPKALNQGELKIGEMTIPCAVLENGERVIADRTLAETLGIRGGGAYYKRRKMESGALSPSQVTAADKAYILLRAFATVGIIALVDEATGYQEIRDREALQEILQKYISGALL